MSTIKNVCVPDIGQATPVPVIEVNVAVGESIEKDAGLVTLESDKASMEIPSPDVGVVHELKVALGDKVSQGDVILTLAVAAEEAATPAVEEKQSKKAEPAAVAPPPPVASPTPATQPSAVTPAAPVSTKATGQACYASPAVRRLAREFGVDVTQVTGSGRKGRLIAEDIKQYVKQRLSAPATGSGLPTMPEVDFSEFGDVEKQPLSRIKKLSGSYLHRNWVVIPHVTQCDEADITALEAFRQQQKQDAEKAGYKLTLLPFVMKAVVASLKAFPTFNASLSADGETLIVKKYYHLGVAVDTKEGLVVPVIRDVDQKSVSELAIALAEVSERARQGKLSREDLQGSCFTISSLGGIGGTAFTPIINAPDVAILGLSRARMQPVYQRNAFVPRRMLPLSLSYDHRVIDGAEGARFIVHLAAHLKDIRRTLL